MNYDNQVNEILVANGLDFVINKLPLGATNEKGDTLVTPYYGLFNGKSGECINTCKEGYGVSQNAEIVEMVLKGMKGFGGLTVQKAGSINGGRRVYMQLAIEGVSNAGNDTIKRYVTIIDSNDGSTGLSVGIGDKFMHCENQFFKFYKAGEAKFRHTATIAAKIQTIPQLIQTALGKSLEQVKIYNTFASTPLTRGLAEKLVNEVFGHDKLSPEKFLALGKRSNDMRDTLFANIERECKDMGSNLLGLFNGVTRYTTHHQNTPKRVNGHDESLLVGTGYDKNITALNFALRHAGLQLS
jgi:hypothetical protein